LLGYVRTSLPCADFHVLTFPRPINTYGGQGAAKRGVDPRTHAIVFVSGTKPGRLLAESGLLENPIEVTPAPGQTLVETSRINFAKVHTVEHNVKVMDVGRVRADSVPYLRSYWEGTWQGERQHLDPTMAQDSDRHPHGQSESRDLFARPSSFLLGDDDQQKPSRVAARSRGPLGAQPSFTPILELSKLSIAPPASSKSFGVSLGQAPQIEPDAFIGRTMELQQLRDFLLPTTHPHRQCIVSIFGMGGMGKTQLSLAHVRDCADYYSSVFWVNATDETSLRQSMANISAIIFPGFAASVVQSADDEKLKIDQVRRWLSEPGNDQWLLIFDNYDDPYLPGIRSPTGYDIRSFFPTCSQGSILITSRSTKLTFSKQLKLQQLEDVHTSVAILSQRSMRDIFQGETQRGFDIFIVAN
jgi:hypothetical protein